METSERWVIAGVLISLALGVGNLAWQVYTYSTQQSLTRPQMIINNVGDLVLRAPSEYTTTWKGEFQIVLFIVAAHEFQIGIIGIDFKQASDIREYVDPTYAGRTSVEIPENFTTAGVASGSVTISVPVNAEIWLSPSSWVYETRINLGTLFCAIKLTDLRTREVVLQTAEISVVWLKQ